MKKTIILTILASSVFYAPAYAKPQTSLAMTGSPAHLQNFQSFAYATPNAKKGGTLKLGATGTFDSLNPFIVRGQPPLGLNTGQMSLVYESLMARSWDEPFTLYPLLAESIEVPEDRSSITFQLNENARFSDGTPVTTDDVMFSFETLRDKGRPNHRTYYKKVTSAEKLSPHKIKFAFKTNDDGTINREMPLIMALMPILPKHDWQEREFNQTTLHKPIGSGAYKITTIDPGRSITYTRNTEYWGKDIASQQGLNNFDTVRVDYYRDDGISLQAFKAGQYDLRKELNPNKWATAYDFPAAKDARVRLERIKHGRVEPAYGFIFNTRRALFADPALRKALQHTFDFAWINKNIFHGQFKRINSYFPNSDLAAPLLPNSQELEILSKYKDKLPTDIFTTPVVTQQVTNENGFRDNLLVAEKQLKEAGYKVRNDELYSPSGNKVYFEILLSDPSEEKVALSWSRSLKRLGIYARVHTVDSAQYQSRLASFDYDVIAGKWFNSLSPGNEQSYFYGSAAADQNGSRNYAGVKDPVVDALASSVPAAKSREELTATVHALDRVLLRGNYFIPLYYSGFDNVAYWTKIQPPPKHPLWGLAIESWNAKE